MTHAADMQLGGGDILEMSQQTLAHSARSALRAARATRRTMRARSHHRRRTQWRTHTDTTAVQSQQQATITAQDQRLTELTARWAASQALAEETRQRLDELRSEMHHLPAANNHDTAAELRGTEADAVIADIHRDAWAQRLAQAGFSTAALDAATRDTGADSELDAATGLDGEALTPDEQLAMDTPAGALATEYAADMDSPSAAATQQPTLADLVTATRPGIEATAGDEVSVELGSFTAGSVPAPAHHLDTPAPAADTGYTTDS